MSDLDYIADANHAFISQRCFAHQYNAPALANELKHLSKVYRHLMGKCDNIRQQTEDEMNEAYMAAGGKQGEDGR